MSHHYSLSAAELYISCWFKVKLAVVSSALPKGNYSVKEALWLSKLSTFGVYTEDCFLRNAAVYAFDILPVVVGGSPVLF